MGSDVLGHHRQRRVRLTPPFPPDSSSDPVVAMAALIVVAELILAGRAGEAVGRYGRARAIPTLVPSATSGESSTRSA